MRAIHVVLLALAAAGAALVWRATLPETIPTATLTRGSAAEVVYATGVVEPRRWAEVTPLQRALIVEVCSCEGDAVTEGQALFRLDDRAARAHLRETEARLDLAEKSLARVEQLLDRSIVSPDRFDTAAAAVAELRAAAAVAAQALEDLVIRSPLDGVALRIDAEVGEVATPGEALAWVGEPRPLLVVAEVNEEDIPRVAEGQTALIKADAFPDRALEATVDSITPMGDTTLRTYRVRLALPDDTPLLIGMSVDVNILERVVEDALLAPAPAVLDGALFVIEEGRLRRSPVEIGVRGAETVQILSGAAEGAVVASPADPALADGARVQAAP
jgi:RND family efflux transporter MFP subunit